MIRIVGLGQPTAGDDGVGVAVVRALRDDPPPNCELVEIRDAARLVDLADGSTAVLLVDAVVGDEPVGTVARCRPTDLQGGRSVSSHGMTVPAALQLAETLHGAVDVEIVAVHIERPAALALGLSEAVRAAIPEAVRLVRQIAGEPHA